MNDYRIAECLNKQSLKPYFAIQRYNIFEKEYVLFLDKNFENLEDAENAVRLLRKYKEPIYHYVSEND